MTRWIESAFGIAFVVIVALLALSIRPTPTPGPEATTAAVPTLGSASLSPTPTWRPTPASPSSLTLSSVSPPAPTTAARSAVGTPARFFRGQATWWNSLGSGYYVAVRPDLGIRVGSVIQVCDAHAQRCVPAPVVTTCACLGPQSGRIVDLSLDLFRRFAAPSAGVVQVVLEAMS